MWSEINNGNKVRIIIGIVFLLFLIVALVIWVFSGNQKALYSDLSTKDAASIVMALEKLKIPYSIGGGGASVFVDAGKADEVKVKLAGEGVIANSEHGFELFDNADIGMTEYSQKINFLRAMQGELARSIMSIDGVKYARVHLVLPETSLFKQKKNSPGASVTIIPKQGVSLNPDQVESIQRLVSSAAPGIDQQKVTVIDNTGKTISKIDIESERENITGLLLKKKKEVEKYLENKVELILNKTFGDNHFIAIISVDLNLDKVHRKEEIILPNKTQEAGVIRKRESVSDITKNKGKENGASSVELDYQLSRRIDEIVSMPGAITRIQLGVLVPEETEEGQLLQLKEVISMAVGLNKSRGDDLAIFPMEMDKILAPLDEKDVPSNMTIDNPEILEAPEAENLIANKYFDQGSKYILHYSSEIYLIYGLGSALFVSLIALLILIRKKEKLKVKRLSTLERDALLSDLKQWLSSEAA